MNPDPPPLSSPSHSSSNSPSPGLSSLSPTAATTVRSRASRWLRGLVGLAAFALVTATVPSRWFARDAETWWRGDPAAQAALARTVEGCVTSSLSRVDFDTGSATFNGEWLFGTYLMAGFGFGQTALEHPEWRPRHAALMEECIGQILSLPLRAFDREQWHGEDPLDSLEGPSHHAAYLGYLNLLLGFHCHIDPASRFAPLHDRISAALARRMDAGSSPLLQTYPGETYPVDNCAVAASLGFHDRLGRGDHSARLDAWKQHVRVRCLDPRTGLLFQAMDRQGAQPEDLPRASGTTLGAYFLSFWDPALSKELFHAVRSNCLRSPLGLGGVQEYAPSTRRESPASSLRGDIDSGPVIFGFGFSPTGFMIANCRIHSDFDGYRRLLASACLCGAPVERGGRLQFVSGGPLGNAILFAMLTAQPGGIPDATAP